jgi:hypothetical protein
VRVGVSPLIRLGEKREEKKNVEEEEEKYL